MRDALVAAAVALIGRKGPARFSLREVARRARVSEAAPYWHFGDREALLAAIAERGFVELAKQMMEIWSRSAAPAERFHPFALLAHGLAALLIDGKLKNHAGSPAAAEQLAHTVTDLVMQDLAQQR